MRVVARMTGATTIMMHVRRTVRLNDVWVSNIARTPAPVLQRAHRLWDSAL